MTDDILSEAKEAFRLSEEREAENRAAALDDLRFARLGEQWPSNIRRKREEEGRPCLTVNRLPAFIRQVMNDIRQNSPSIIVHPTSDGADAATAQILQGLIRNIEVTSKAEIAYDTAADFAVTMGFGYFRINTRYAEDDTFDLDLCIERVANPFAIYGDPYSTAADSADWNSAFVVDVLTKEAFERKYKGADAVDWKGEAYGDLSAPWIEGESVRVAEYWRREEAPRKILLLSDQSVVGADVYARRKDEFDALGLTVVTERTSPSHKVRQYIISGAEVLEERDWAGRYIPIVPVWGEEVNVEGKRFLRSLVRDAKDPQRMFNYWRTTSTELVALAPKTPFIGPKGAFVTDAAKWATANTETHAYIEYDGGAAPERQPFAGPPAGALQEAMNAADDMKGVMGLFDASLGAPSNETSGRAILLRQKEGDVSTFHFADNLARAIEHGGRILIDLIPTIYSAPRVIRTIGPDGGRRPPIPLGAPAPALGPDGRPLADPETGQTILRLYDLTLGKYDVTVETGPSFTTRREEAAQQMIEFVQAYPAAAPMVGDLLVKNLDWPGADEIAQRLQAMLPPQASGQAHPDPDPETQGMIQQGMAKIGQLSSQLQQAQSELAALKADKAVEARRLDVEAFRAQTERMQAAHAISQAAPQLQASAVEG
jgi:hypothetical protein